jgi:hypothetical protein
MSKPLLIIISGPPCSGKTRLGSWLAEQLKIPLFHRDGFKELLFDRLGWSDLEWSQRLGDASYGLLYYAVEALLQAECSLMIESNFDPQYDTQRLHELAMRHPFLALQIRCQQRAASGQRHPGHLDHLNIPIYEPIVREGAGARNDFLDIGGERIDIETSDFAALDYDRILALVRAAIARLEGSGGFEF